MWLEEFEGVYESRRGNTTRFTRVDDSALRSFLLNLNIAANRVF